MGDWAYGASWLATGKVDCNPSTFGGTYLGLWVCVSLSVGLDVLTAGLCGPLCFCALVFRFERQAVLAVVLSRTLIHDPFTPSPFLRNSN